MDQEKKNGKLQVKKFHQELFRKPYLKPQLTSYGNIEKLTQGVGSRTAEGGGRFRN